jgi:hypothetical protein
MFTGSEHATPRRPCALPSHDRAFHAKNTTWPGLRSTSVSGSSLRRSSHQVAALEVLTLWRKHTESTLASTLSNPDLSCLYNLVFAPLSYNVEKVTGLTISHCAVVILNIQVPTPS